jgi:YidC/Oxa1 family membrane protein insertase
MNTQEKILAAALGLALLLYMVYNTKQNARQLEQARVEQREASTLTNTFAQVDQKTDQNLPEIAEAVAEKAELPPPDAPEKVVEIENEYLRLTLSSHGAVIQSVLLKDYNSYPGERSPDNPPVVLDFNRAPGLQIQGVAGLAPNAAYQIERSENGESVVFRALAANGLVVERSLELQDNYQIRLIDTFRNKGVRVMQLNTNALSVGSMYRGSSKNDILSVDAMPAVEKADVLHWDKEKQTRGFIGGSGGFGCGGGKPALGLPERMSIPMRGAQKWVAVKSRFFVTAFISDAQTSGYRVDLYRDTSKEKFVLESLSADVLFPATLLDADESLSREYTLYVGPKKLDLLRAMGNNMDAVMQFGKFRWFCELLVPTLNFFYRIIPNYGIAVILLTVLVRIIFWPLTHKSTKSMRKMQEIQPEIKALQVKYKDNPQKLQQETWAIYKKNKVNPMSSCLPMLIQIPVFIALFTVLRSAVELRYASFLWIADLSEPENLFAGSIPLVGSLNILPILMSGTMALQSYLTPSAGDPQQQKMMMIMMPVMMLFMFYSFPSALSLYWTVSQVLSIVQMLMMRRHHGDSTPGKDKIDDAVVVTTRQQRRQSARS